MPDQGKIVRDPIHGFIKLSPWEQRIVDHPVFQRLRRIRQLALTDMVYPGACHTRFEHSLGVMHVATRMFDQLRPQLNTAREAAAFDFNDDDLARDRTIVRLAALLHDVGHCPFSHAGEEVMPKRSTGKRYKHEDYSVALIRHMLRDTIENDDDNELGVKVEEVCSFIEKSDGIPAHTLFWRPLISGQMDADRSDYLLRDSYHAGVAYGRYDIERLISTLRFVRDPETDDLAVGIETGGMQAVEGLLLARYMMFLQVYFHHSRRAYDRHVTGALKHVLAKEHGDAFGESGVFPPPEHSDPAIAVNNLQQYVQWNDARVLAHIDAGEAGDHGHIIRNRQHDRRVHETSPFPTTEEMDEFYKRVLPAVKEFGAWDDHADSSWYKFGKTTEIRLAKVEEGVEEHPIPLQEKSSLVRSLQPVTLRRVYVPAEHKDRANAVLAG